MKNSYSFSILRYVHDPVTQEFINIGVVVYSRQAAFLKAMCTTHYARVSRTFVKIDGNRFRQLTRFIEEKINSMGSSLPLELPFEPLPGIEKLLDRVLPTDDSSVQFSPAGVGV